MPASSIVGWSFLDNDDGQPGEPADWVKKRIRMYEKWKDEFHQEMLEDLKHSHQWTCNIPPPSTPKKYDPNKPPFNTREIFGDSESTTMPMMALTKTNRIIHIPPCQKTGRAILFYTSPHGKTHFARG